MGETFKKKSHFLTFAVLTTVNDNEVKACLAYYQSLPSILRDFLLGRMVIRYRLRSITVDGSLGNGVREIFFCILFLLTLSGLWKL